MERSNAEHLNQAYEAVWQSFIADGKVEPAFGKRSGDGTVHLVFICPIGAFSDVAERIAPVQHRLAFPYADLVPRQRLHVSIQGLDVPESDWEQRGEELLSAARHLFNETPPFTVHLGWPNSFPMAAILQAEDGGVIRHWRAELRRRLPTWTGIEHDPMVREGQDTWLPHLSLAYYHSEDNNRALVEAIQPMRDQAVAEVLISEVHLISTPQNMTGDERWLWPVHGVFELAG